MVLPPNLVLLQSPSFGWAKRRAYGAALVALGFAQSETPLNSISRHEASLNFSLQVLATPLPQLKVCFDARPMLLSPFEI
ncbi:hypothetical protein SAMN04488118_103413 [Epibacterium ulvae]|uniref:Uncharacterized protein n=1 Tax=Epibacterium ulvae TaxID=1156985 RepID=A0A1G5QC70_9RHOB|nr:hypothetical protein SAMN04488118_103413 [Epibacterium ulvae]